MSEIAKSFVDLPPAQQAIRAKCFHPSGSFVEFGKEEIEQSIPERFEKIVAKYPKRIAVKTGSTTLTYEALNRIANQIAWAILEKRGSRPEPIVLLLEHGAPMIAAIIAALKAGKIYVPLDFSLPPARVADILEDAQAEMIVRMPREFDPICATVAAVVLGIGLRNFCRQTGETARTQDPGA